MSEVIRGVSGREALVNNEPISLGDKKVLVVGIEHGGGEPFPSYEAAEKRLGEAFGGRGAEALVLDTFGGIGQMSTGISPKELPSIAKRVPRALKFREWGVRYAEAHGSTLVVADPVGMSGTILNLASGEVIANQERRMQESGSYPKVMELRRQWSSVWVEEDKASLERNLLLVAEVTATVPLSLYFLAKAAGRAKRNAEENLGSANKDVRRRKLGRREFFFTTAVAGTSVLLAAAGWEANRNLRRLRGTREGLQKEESNILAEVFREQNEDYRALDELFGEGREITAGDKNTISYGRTIDREGKSLKDFSIVLRNAVIAEACAMPANGLVFQRVEGDVNVAVMMGYLHEVADESVTIPWFIQHESERRQIIQDFFGQVFKIGSEQVETIESYLGSEFGQKLKANERTKIEQNLEARRRDFMNIKHDLSGFWEYQISADGKRVEKRFSEVPFLVEVGSSF